MDITESIEKQLTHVLSFQPLITACFLVTLEVSSTSGESKNILDPINHCLALSCETQTYFGGP